MKAKTIILAVFVLLAASCISRIDFHSGLDENMLVVNARFRTDESRHMVSVSVSTLRESVQRVTDAKVDVFVNGKFHSTAKYFQPVYDYVEDAVAVIGEGLSPGYYFDADLQDGDEVRVEVSWDGLHASATANAPRAIELSVIDTVTVMETPYFSNCDALKCTVRLQDVPGEDNWLRFLWDYHYEVTRHQEDSSVVEQGSTITIPFFFDDDPVLRGDFHSSREQDAIKETDLNLPLVTNKYCIFTDSGFAGSYHTADLYIRGSVFYSLQPGSLYPRTADSSLSLRLLSMSRDEFLYLSAYTNAEANGLMYSGDLISQVLFEPVTFPSNVEGGLGFVCVETVSRVILDLPQQYSPPTRYSAYWVYIQNMSRYTITFGGIDNGGDSTFYPRNSFTLQPGEYYLQENGHPDPDKTFVCAPLSFDLACDGKTVHFSADTDIPHNPCILDNWEISYMPSYDPPATEYFFIITDEDIKVWFGLD